MSEPLQLPEGVTFNKYNAVDTSIELPFDTTQIWKCPKCELQFEALLIGESGRHSGQIKVSGNQAISWQGALPKDKNKAEKFLQDALKKKVDFHLERH